MRHSVSTYDGQQFPERHLNSAETEQQLRDLLENLWSEEEEQEAMPALEDRTGTPDGLVVTLMEHQKVGLRWLKKMEASKNKGGILSDDMGLGKTIQAIALILDNQCQDATPFDEIESSFKGKQKQKGDPLKVKGTLVVCPVSLIAQWEKEINQKTSPPLSVLVYHGAGRKSSPAILAKYDVIITSYNVLSGDVGRDTDKLGTHHRDIDKGGPLSNFIFHRIILDEAHTIKNRRTRMAEGCCLMKAEFRWCMTATPIQNNIGDLYSLIKFLQIRPYCEWDQFRDCISRPLKMGRHKQALKVIQILLKAISLRRSKKSTIDGKPILNLPERNVHFTHISFTQQEREFYDYVDAKAQACFEKLVNAGTVMKNYSSVLVLLLRLRQACLHPRLTNEEGFDRKAAMEEMAAIVQSMPEVVVNRLLDTNTSFTEIECPICMDMADQPQIISDCGHMLCRECLYNFLNVQDGVNGNKKCPQCRGILTRDKVVTVDQFLKVHAPERHQTTEVDFMDSENTIKIQELTTSSKINKMIEILNDTRKTTQGKDKTIVFSQFTSMLDVLGAPLLENNYNFVRYDGAMTVRKRADVLEKFSTDPSITVLLVSTKCGSLGLNVSHRVYSMKSLLDIWWNPALENQAIDRVHRIGQTKPVEVHRIFIKDTVEDRILELQKSKQALCDGALGEGSGEKLGRLGLQEMLYLFSRNASSDT
ncbi:SNF2 family N-terminal domain-containing protein [Spinellus fusiger]|nr:SNF2 family N-terminal domain-containing protein [Spinellus fusiger]